MRLYRSDCLGEVEVVRLGETRALAVDGEVFMFVTGSTDTKGANAVATYDLNDGGWIGRQGYSGVLFIGPDVASDWDMDAMEADDRSVLVAIPGNAEFVHSSLREAKLVFSGCCALERTKLVVVSSEGEGRVAFSFHDHQFTIHVNETGMVTEEMADREIGRVMLRIEDREFFGFSRDLWGNERVTS